MKNPIILIIFVLIISSLSLWVYAKNKFPNLASVEIGTEKGIIEGTGNFEFEYPVFDGWTVEYIKDDKLIYTPSILYKIANLIVNKIEIKISLLDYLVAPDLSKYTTNSSGIYYKKDIWSIEFYDNGGGIKLEQAISTINPILNLDTIAKTFKNTSSDDIKEDISIEKLPTTFKLPSKEPSVPYIKDATIERIEIPGYSGMYADIVMSIDGVSDERIIKINDELTLSIFSSDDYAVVDIRKKENRILNKSVTYIEGFGSKIIYIDKNYIQYRYSINADTGGAHPAMVFDQESIIKTSGEDFVLFSKENSNKILEHFYPNGEELFEEFRNGNEELECFADTSFPDSFDSEIKINTKEIIFYLWFPHVSRVCNGEFQKIAIPISDILNEVPQYVPKDSVLWEFR